MKPLTWIFSLLGCVSVVLAVSECRGVGGVRGVRGVRGVECRGCRAMSMCFDHLDTTRGPPLSRSLDTGVGVSGPSVGLVSVGARAQSSSFSTGSFCARLEHSMILMLMRVFGVCA